MQDGAHQIDAALCISKDPCITEQKGKLIKWEGVCASGFWRFEDYKCWERLRPGEISSSLKSLAQAYWHCFDCSEVRECRAECYIIGVTMSGVYNLINKIVYIYIRKSMGAITEPWGTPAFVAKDSDDIPSTTTLVLRFTRKLSNHLRSVGVNPKAGSLARRFLCQTWSKAFETTRTMRGSLSRSLEFCSRHEYHVKMSPVERYRLNSYCLSWIILLVSTRTFWLITISIILERSEVIALGL